MQQLTNQERLRPWMGFLLSAIVVLALLFAGSAMQRAWGLWGLVATELMLLMLAVGYCLICRVRLKEVFPVRRISGREFGGTLLLLAGGYGASMIALGISLTIMPSSIKEISALRDYLYADRSVWLLIPVAAVLPAICEETLMRGAILSSFRSWKRDWLIVLTVGIVFGIFHLSPLRFLSTSILGMLLAYLMVKRNNILLPMLLHFLNNLIAVALSALSGAAAQTVDAAAAFSSIQPVQLLGSYLVLGCCCPLLLVLGAKLISPETHRKKRFLIAGIASGVLFIAGLLMTILPVFNGMIRTLTEMKGA